MNNILDLDYPELVEKIEALNQPAFRARQVWQALYRDLVSDFSEISTLPAGLRKQLGSAYFIGGLTPAMKIQSNDGFTEKILFALKDGLAIETVLMQYSKRNTLCISSQAGCAMGCVFCATGQMGFQRHLAPGEIIEQVLFYARVLRQLGQEPTNIVLMGMGEPFHNYDATLKAIKIMNHVDGLGLGLRRFTISTVGIIPKIEQFMRDPLNRQINLAVSLHASTDNARSAMLPVNKRYPIKDLLQVCRQYTEQTGRRITFEWALIKNQNDTPFEAHALGRLLKGMLCHVNVIRLNPTQGYSGKATDRERANQFCEILESYGISCTIRMRRGIDIQAGCGQLATTHKGIVDIEG